MILRFYSSVSTWLRVTPACFRATAGVIRGKPAYQRCTPLQHTRTFAHKPSDQAVTFNDLHIDRRLVHAAERLGVTQPTEMQQTLLHTLHSTTTDVLLRHSTGSGKTFAILLWLLTQALRNPRTTPRGQPSHTALLLVPSRELALQIEQWAQALLSGIPVERASVLQRFVRGSEYSAEQQEMLRRHGVPRVALGTARCFLDAEYAEILQAARCVVVDEVDAVVAVPGKHASDKLVKLRREKPRPGVVLVDRVVRNDDVRLVMASATANKQLRRFVRRWSRDVQLVDLLGAVSVPKTLRHHCLVIGDQGTIRNMRAKDDEEKPETRQEEEEGENKHYRAQGVLEQQHEFLQAADALAEVTANVIAQLHPHGTMVFIRSDAPSQLFLEHLAAHGVPAVELVSRYAEHTEETSEAPVYLATEEAARGVDVPLVDLVLILDVPRSAASYAHLAGRAGRFGRAGKVVCVVPEGAWGFHESKMRGVYKALGLAAERLDFVE